MTKVSYIRYPISPISLSLSIPSLYLPPSLSLSVRLFHLPLSTYPPSLSLCPSLPSPSPSLYPLSTFPPLSLCPSLPSPSLCPSLPSPSLSLYPLSTFPPLSLSVRLFHLPLSRYILSLLSLPSLPSPSHQYTFSELLSIVQASERELWDALDKQHACLIDGTLYYDNDNNVIVVMCTRIV